MNVKCSAGDVLKNGSPLVQSSGPAAPHFEGDAGMGHCTEA